jgi:4-hydroxy-3-methylbut-2-en-1-yl diphosphate synthase IspG/GcpE
MEIRILDDMPRVFAKPARVKGRAGGLRRDIAQAVEVVKAGAACVRIDPGNASHKEIKRIVTLVHACGRESGVVLEVVVSGGAVYARLGENVKG